MQGLFHLITLPDPSYNIGFVTSAIETNLALITASAPALTPVLRSWFPSLFGQESSAPGGGAAGGPNATRIAALRGTQQSKVELRGRTPRKSEEEAMTYNGIVRQTELESRSGPNGEWPLNRF